MKIEAPWHQHNGAGIPVRESTQVRVRFREGTETTIPCLAGELHGDKPDMSNWYFSAANPEDDIVEYQVVLDV